MEILQPRFGTFPSSIQVVVCKVETCVFRKHFHEKLKKHRVFWHADIKVAEVSWLDTFKEYIREKEAGEYTKDLKILSASHLSLKSYEKICMKN